MRARCLGKTKARSLARLGLGALKRSPYNTCLMFDSGLLGPHGAAPQRERRRALRLDCVVDQPLRTTFGDVMAGDG